MKKILLTITIVLITKLFTIAQCGTIMVNATTLQHPDTVTNLPNAPQNNNYVTAIQFYAPSLINGLAINSITLVSVSGLPSGFNYQKYPSSGVLNVNNSGCIVIQSNSVTAPIGIFPIVINININTVSLGSIPTQINGYKIRVVSNRSIVGSVKMPGNYQVHTIGNTLNNQQSNASVYRRIQLLPNNKVGVTWTTSTDGTPFVNRGTGYNQFNGTNWINQSTSSPRIENQRAGFPSYAYNPITNEEVILSHIVTNNGYSGGMVLSRRTAGSNGAWTQTTVLDTISTVPGVLWCRTAISNNLLHVIACYGDSNASQPNRVIKNGVRTPVVYSRYSFASNSWQVINTPLTDYNSIRYFNGSSDEYAIDANGNAVAILVAGMNKDITLWKSNNNGSTWNRIVIDSFKYSPYNNLTCQTLMLDTPYTNDGSVSVLIDNSSVVHCFWARSRTRDNDLTDQSFLYFPGTSIMAYWNDSRSYTSKTYFPDNRTGNILNGGSKYGNTSAVTMPSTGISSNGKIFCTYSILGEDDDDGTQSFRDINLIYSSDNGATWSAPRNLTRQFGFGLEQAYPSLGRMINDKLHLTFTESGYTGPNSAGNWHVKYMSIDTSAILTSAVLEDSIIISYAIPDTIICRGRSLTYTVSNGSLWKGTNLIAINPQSATITPDVTASYTIRSLNGSTVIRTFTIVVNDSLLIQPISVTDSINICGNHLTKFPLGITTGYSGTKYYSWFRNDTFLINNINAIDTFELPGKYKLAVSTTSGCLSEKTFYVNKYNNIFNPDFITNRQTATSPPFIFTFSNNTTPLSDYNFTWSWGDGNSLQSNAPSNNYTYANIGTYSVKLVAQNKVSGCKDSILKVNYITCSGGSSGALTINTNKINPACYGQSNGSITVTAAGGTSPYQYRINNGTYQSSNTFSNLPSGIYTIQLKDATNTTVSKTDTLIDPAMLIVGGITGNNGVPVGSTQAYNIAAQSGAVYSWNIINGTLLSGNGTNSVTVQWAAIAGSGKVIANITKNGCSAADTLTVAIGSNPLIFSSSITNETCPGKQNGVITFSATGGNAPYQYSINNGTFQTSNVFINLTAGVYLSKVKDAMNVIAQQYDTIRSGQGIILGAMNGPVNVSPNALSTYIVGQQTGLNYVWSATNGVIATGQGTNMVQVSWGATAGTGKVKVIATSSAGCVDSSLLNVSIGTTGLQAMNEEVYYRIYPNPVKKELIINNDGQSLSGSHIIISDMLGRKVLEFSITESSSVFSIPVQELKNGAYILSLQKEGETSRMKFVKE